VYLIQKRNNALNYFGDLNLDTPKLAGWLAGWGWECPVIVNETFRLGYAILLVHLIFGSMPQGTVAMRSNMEEAETHYF
jgi:hypothetical protein